MKFFSTLFIILLCITATFATKIDHSYTSIKPELERYTSIEQWENPNNWSPNIVPSENTILIVKNKSLIIDFNLDVEKKVVGAIDISNEGEFVVTPHGSIFITNTLTINPKSALVIEGALKVQKAVINASNAKFSLKEIGSIDAHEIFLKIDNYIATLNGHISSTYLNIHFLDKNAQLRIGDEAEIHIQSDLVVKNKFKDNILGDLSKITTSGCQGNEAFCKQITAYRLKLPTIVDYFDIEIENDITFAYWETSTERNSSHFIIEKSYDGENFIELGRVDANGKSSSENPYELKDDKYEKDKDTFYRLRAVQQNGEEFIWCRHLLANHLDKEEFGIEKVYPNPTNYYLKLDFQAQKSDVLDIKLHHTENESIWDIKPEIEENKAVFDVHHYPAGSYILKVKMNGQLVYTGNVIIHATNSKGNIRNSQAILVEEGEKK
ncbi:T9SS type A sorting domain-containing protein [Flammeovirga aprica]|uniref:Secretion system C-terminal sorting domain-containing protein n=1 Tax=Flammeovirga aprica JL-4 TaxID=694437 RepID=A0A7X9S161_9BACT|nr:hypothetical protein [Flammeovirga aprica]NME72354.1 hypothetical protein [Flammeovirga aprica JL-4]